MNRTRRDFLSSAAVLGVGGMIGYSPIKNLLGASLSELNSIKARRKNVLFIAVDDLRPELSEHRCARQKRRSL
jgi:hypothetical protein